MPRLFYDLSCLSVVASSGFQALSYGFQALFHEAVTFAGYRPSQGAGFHRVPAPSGASSRVRHSFATSVTWLVKNPVTEWHSKPNTDAEKPHAPGAFHPAPSAPQACAGQLPPDQCRQAAPPTLSCQNRRYMLFVLRLSYMLFFYNHPSSSDKLLPDVEDLKDGQGK